LVLGAGGTARAVAGLVTREGAAGLVVAARQVAAAQRLLADVAARQGRASVMEEALALADAAALADALEHCDVLVNATSVGMDDSNASPIDPALLGRLPRSACVLDVVYTPPETALLRAARSLGLAAVGGLTMLLHQGTAAFELWTGRPAPLDVMRAALGM
jgi:shikimate dehydrogenase